MKPLPRDSQKHKSHVVQTPMYPMRRPRFSTSQQAQGNKEIIARSCLVSPVYMSPESSPPFARLFCYLLLPLL